MFDTFQREIPKRFEQCRKLRDTLKKRKFIDAKKISEKHNKIYSKIAKDNGSQTVLMPNSNYEIYVDEDLVKKGAIDPRTIALERFYEALDELD